jgi:hypothetical protein
MTRATHDSSDRFGGRRIEPEVLAGVARLASRFGHGGPGHLGGIASCITYLLSVTDGGYADTDGSHLVDRSVVWKFMESPEPRVRRAGIFMSAWLPGDVIAESLNSRSDIFAGDAYAWRYFARVASAPDDEKAKWALAQSLAAMAKQGGSRATDQHAVIRYLDRVAETLEPPINGCENALGLPLNPQRRQ